ncbi:MAG: SOS response-associated peptidase [Desulfomonile sp.]|nr:SOS response-associated peptidase [Desulfomonile sp.]
MCGRFVLMSPGGLVAEHFLLPEEPELEPRYNIAPSRQIAAIRLAKDSSDRELVCLTWGLVPFWAKDRTIGYKMINAKCETVAEKPAFRAAFRDRRCLVPANGFFEWKRDSGRKQPYFIYVSEEGLLAFAGLWERWTAPGGDVLESCTILTTCANELVSSIHDRMPVILDPADYALWLDRTVKGPEPLMRLFKPYSAERMMKRAVTGRVNSPSNDDPSCIEALR